MAGWPAALLRFDVRLRSERRIVIPEGGWSGSGGLGTAPGDGWVLCLGYRPRRTPRDADPVHELLYLELDADPHDSPGQPIEAVRAVYQAGNTGVLYRAAAASARVVVTGERRARVVVALARPAIDVERRGALRIAGDVMLDTDERP